MSAMQRRKGMEIKSTHNKRRNGCGVGKVSSRDDFSSNPLVAVREVMFIDSKENVVKLLDFLLVDLGRSSEYGILKSRCTQLTQDDIKGFTIVSYEQASKYLREPAQLKV